MNIDDIALEFLAMHCGIGRDRGGSRRVAKFLSESHTFHIKSKAIKMLSYKNFATPQGSATEGG